MTPLDLVLINPGCRVNIYQVIHQLAAIETPVWCGLLATFVRRRGFSVEILDANAEDLAPDQVAERVEAMAPRLVAVVPYGHHPSASTQVMPSAGDICTAIRLRTPTQKILMVGGHAAALPERTLNEENVDHVATGEGAQTLVELLQAMRSGDQTMPPRGLTFRSGMDFDVVHGVAYRDEQGHLCRTAAAPNVEHLDRDMPAVAWDLFMMERYRAHNWHCWGGRDRRPYAALYTSLGCPFSCSFCCIQSPFKAGESLAHSGADTPNSYRRWSPDAVVAQIDTLVQRYGIRNIKIADEMFVLNRGHVLGICRRLIERHYDLNLWAYARVDTVPDDLLGPLVEAGFRWLAFGVESASARVRDDVRKGFDQDLIARTFERVRAAGIHIGANYIFGLPEDDGETMQQTLDLACALNTEYANFYVNMYYPGSALYRQAIRDGWPVLPARWSAYAQHAVDTEAMPTRHLPGAEVLRFRDQAFLSYFTRPEYLAMMERTFGAATVAEIRAMTGYRLERSNA